MTTATDIQQGTRRTISGTVQNPREDGHGHYLVDLQGTGWTQDKYAVTAFQVGGSETLAALPVGRHIEVVVEAQQKRDGKDGSRERDWYWRIVGPSNGAAPAAEPAPAPLSPIERRVRDLALSRDPTRDSIERQVSLKAAVDLASNGVLVPEEGKGLLDTIEGAADRFIAWLQGTAPAAGAGSAAERPPLVKAAEDMGGVVASEPEPNIDESQAPTSVDDLQF